MYRLDYYDKDGNHKEIHGFRTPKEAECYMKIIQKKILMSH